LGQHRPHLALEEGERLGGEFRRAVGGGRGRGQGRDADERGEGGPQSAGGAARGHRRLSGAGAGWRDRGGLGAGRRETPVACRPRRWQRWWMMTSMRPSARCGPAIVGTGHYVPQRVLTNEDLTRWMDTSDEWITARTGVKERRLAAEDENSGTMALAASRLA